MPVLDKKPFVRNKPPKDLSPNEELFYCKLTHEVFRDYEDFFKRVILCNSLVWTCSLTGRSNLTFAEALDSEKAARESLMNFPSALKKPVLYLASLTERGRLNDMCDEVFMFVKDRYFVGEEVEAIVNGVKRSCEVTQVVLPERQQKSPAKDSRQRKVKDISPSKIKYEVVDYNTGKTSTVKADNISRLKGSYTKPKNKLFVKHNTKPENGMWKVKENVASNLQLDDFEFSESFAGPLPSYVVSPSKKKLATVPDKTGKKTIQGKLNFKKETVNDKKLSQHKQQAQFEKSRLAAEKAKEDLRRRIEEDKEKQRLEKVKEREKRKEEKKIKAENLILWKKPRDDLECDDLKDLPLPTPVECSIPQSCFGDAIMVLEFLNTFGNQLQVKNTFPYGVTFEHIEKALVETDIQGVFNDLLQLFLTNVFQLQETDDPIGNQKSKDNLIKVLDKDNPNLDEVISLAVASAAWPQKYHGTVLRNMPLDSFSITEILRLHILSSGGRSRVNWQNIVLPSEDPGLFFKMEEPNLIKELATTSVFQLNCEDRLKILTLLINQLLCCGTLKYAVDEIADKTRPLRHQLKQLRWAYTRKQREEILNKKKIPQKEKGEVEEAPEEPINVDDEEKENTDNLSPAEKAELDEKKEKEVAKQKTEFLRKEREIESQIRNMQSSFNVTPIGRDRSYRRYWIFQSVAGIFLEDDDPFKGSCLPRQTVQQHNPSDSMNRSDVSTSSIKKYMHHLDENKNGSSDKENEILRDIAMVQSDIASPLKHRKLSDLNPRVDFKKSAAADIDEDDLPLLCLPSKSCSTSCPLDQCTANIETCVVHNNSIPKTRWAFFYQEEDLEALLAGLNSRGFRERPLKEALVNEKERIKEMMTKCPSNVFNKTISVASQQEVRKSERKRQLQSSAYATMEPQEALDLTMRDMVLELEHRIFAGGLGSLKVSDRETWKKSLEEGRYDMQCDKISWRKDDEYLCRVRPDSEDEESSQVVDKTVKNLACAMLQVSQGIEAKYLLPPLGETEAFKASRQKALIEVALWESQQKKKDGIQSPKVPISLLEKWQESLMESTSTSQLFVHLGTLERSVAWSRSVLKAHCKICRRRGDGENMLLCDGCNRGHHLYCLKPPLEAIPEGDWFCLTCKPVEKTLSPQKKEKVDSDSEVDEECSENESEESDEDEENEDSEMNETYIEESCELCGDVGTLICCDKCPLMFHPECVNLKRIPRGEWLCPKCCKKEEAVKKAQKHPASGSHSTRSQTLSTDSKKRSNPSLKTRFATKGVKRLRDDSSDSEFAPAKRAKRESRSSNRDSAEKENPFKKVYRDSALNTSRRRSKGGGGDSDMLDYKACIDLLVELMHHPSSWPFMVPVSKKDAPDYHQIIKRPMDFGTIRSKLNYMQYKNNEDFVRDIYLVLQNCEWFNPKSSPEFKAAQDLYREVKRLLREYQICNPFAINGRTQNVNEEC